MFKLSKFICRERNILRSITYCFIDINDFNILRVCTNSLYYYLLDYTWYTYRLLPRWHKSQKQFIITSAGIVYHSLS